MILLGKPIAEKIYSKLKKDVEALKTKNIAPTLAVILVGEDPASLTYVKAKQKQAQKLGINFKFFHLPGIAREGKILALINNLNNNKFVDGIVVQMPLPEGIDADKIIKVINPNKDIDGFSGKFRPPTAQAIWEILGFYNIDLKNKKVVIIGYGRLVGKPLAELLKKQKLEPVICTSSSDIAAETLDADIIISATGVPGLIKAEMVSQKAVVIDAGTAESHQKISGDVDPKVYGKITSYTPTPGGVGPVTVACLLRNLIEAIKKK